MKNVNNNKLSCKRFTIIFLATLMLFCFTALIACRANVTLSFIAATYIGQDVEIGGSLDKSKIIVKAKYSDNSTKTVTDFAITGFTSETAGDKSVTVSYTENGVTKSVFIVVKVVAEDVSVTLTSIQATYNGNDIQINGTLNKSDVTVVATYSDGTSKDVTDFSIGGLDSSTAGQHNVVVSYTEGGLTRTCTVTVNVKESQQPKPENALVGIAAEYIGANIKVNGSLDNTDIAVTAHYSDGNSRTVTNFSVSGFSSVNAGTCVVTVTYTEGVTVECTVNVTIVDDSPEIIVNSNLSIHFLELGNQYTGDCVYIKAGETDILIDAAAAKIPLQR